MRIEPFEAMAEYLGLQLGARGLIDMGLKNKALRQLLEGAPGWRELITLGKIWHLEQMKDSAEGASNLLDNSVVLLASDCGEGWNHTTFDHPIVVAGGGAGRLRTGFHYRSDTAENTSDILLACAKASAPDISEVGSGGGYSNTPTPELVA